MSWIETSSGIALPTPALESGKVTISTLVDGGRNSEGMFIGSVIGDDKLKVECKFNVLDPEQMQTLLQIFDRNQGGHFINTFRVFDPRVNDFVYLDMYVGDRSGTPYMVNKKTMQPSFWRNVQANLIQV